MSVKDLSLMGYERILVALQELVLLSVTCSLRWIYSALLFPYPLLFHLPRVHPALFHRVKSKKLLS